MSISGVVKPALLCLAVLPLGACAEDYLNRMDTVTLAAGDAKEVNRTAHMIDPWPRHSANPKLVFNGTRMAAAVGRYETGNVTKTEAAATSKVAAE